MRRSGNFFSFSLFALFVETIFLFLLFLKGYVISSQNLLAFPIIVSLFICFREYIEWRDYVFDSESHSVKKIYVSDNFSSELRSYVVRDNVFSSLMFALLSSLFLIASNYVFISYSNVIFSLSLIAGIFCWLSFNFLKEINMRLLELKKNLNHAHVVYHMKNLKEVELWQK